MLNLSRTRIGVHIALLVAASVLYLWVWTGVFLTIGAGMHRVVYPDQHLGDAHGFGAFMILIASVIAGGPMGVVSASGTMRVIRFASSAVSMAIGRRTDGWMATAEGMQRVVTRTTPAGLLLMAIGAFIPWH